MTSERELDDVEAGLLEIELVTMRAVSSRLHGPFTRLWAILLSLWPGDDADSGAKRQVIQRLNVSSLLTPMSAVESEILKGTLSAFKHGQHAANDMLELAGAQTLPVAVRGLPEALRQSIHHATTAMYEQTSKARTLLGFAQTLEEAQAGLVVAKRGISRVEAVAAYTTNSAANEAITEASHQDETVVSIWRAERNACVHCLAYQGQIDTGNGYPAGLTFGSKPLSTEPVVQPPLHPHCRCTQWIVERETSTALAQSLKREAERSVLRGWSLPSESETVRIDAARRLLQNGSNLPKSVKQYAERAVKHGEFSKGRKPPV